MSMLKIIRRKVRNRLHVFLMKKRCRKLNIEYKEGCYIGKRIRTLGDSPKIIIGKNTRLSDDCVFWGDGTIEIGDNSSIGEYGWVHSMLGHKVKIGNYVNFAAFPYIINCDHQTSKKEIMRKQGLVGEDITIGDDIWVGANVTILKGTTIANGCVVGAGSVLKGNYLNEYSIIFGPKAKEMKKRQ